ncbi:MAG: Lrp/AsnC family transcriptional regulator [Candidatus Sumerlaeia bacterium]|nr:Lrp/AsnC family transcriptional regulator [Candidatus Sumerlaeia bacterium]
MSLQLLAERPDLVRLLKTTMAALPLREDFWSVLAHGIGVTTPQLGALLEELYACEAARGLAGEPNPLDPDCPEALCRTDLLPPEAAVRWRADGFASALLPAAPPAGAAPALGWYKVGWLPDLTLPDTEDLLAASTDRSLLDVEPVRPAEAEQETLEAVRAYFETPRRWLPPRTPWEQAAEALGLSPDVVRDTVARLVLARRWRRFAMRLDLGALGWRGVAVAGWRIEDPEVARAAQALARVTGSGDVALRPAGGAFDCNLTALLIGRQPGVGMDAALRIADRWNRPLAFRHEVLAC